MSKRVLTFIFCAAIFLSACDEADERVYTNPRFASDPEASPFSGAVRADDTLYVSGMLGLENGQLPEDPADEARNLLNSIQATVNQAGMSMDDLVYVTVYASELDNYAVFNAVYRTYFTGAFPARAFIGAGSLLSGARFEMQAIAVRRPSSRVAPEETAGFPFSFF